MLSIRLRLLIILASVGFLDALLDLGYIAWLGLGIAFLSATQDIVLDAYRRQILPEQE